MRLPAAGSPSRPESTVAELRNHGGAGLRSRSRTERPAAQLRSGLQNFTSRLTPGVASWGRGSDDTTLGPALISCSLNTLTLVLRVCQLSIEILQTNVIAKRA